VKAFREQLACRWRGRVAIVATWWLRGQSKSISNTAGPGDGGNINGGGAALAAGQPMLECITPSVARWSRGQSASIGDTVGPILGGGDGVER